MTRLIPAAVVVALLCGFAQATHAQPKVQGEDDKPRAKRDIKPCRDDSGELLPLFKLYEVAGRKWKVKRVTSPTSEGADRFDKWFGYEVLEVLEDRAIVRHTAMDASGAPRKDDTPANVEVRFDADNVMFGTPIGCNKVKEESITVAAGKFDCIQYAGALDNTRIWVSKEYPSLVVRMTGNSGSSEVIEFERFSTDTAPPRKAAAREGELDFSLYKQKRSWLIKTLSIKGGVNHHGHMRYEVSKPTAKGAELKITPLNESKKPLKDAKPQEKVVPFSDEGREFIEPPLGATKLRLEKRKTAAGVMSCVVYRFKDDQGREVHLWMAQDLPGLVVRTLIGENGAEGGLELIEFK